MTSADDLKRGGKDLRTECPPAERSLVRVIHAASVNATEWPSVLEQLRSVLDARVVTLGYHAFSSGSDADLLESPDDTAFGNGMAAYSARNPWFLCSDDYVSGRVMAGDELINPDDLRRTDFYRGFLQPRGLLHRLCGVADRGDAGAHLVSAYRAEDQAAFGPRETAALEVLLDHITLSLRSQWRWQEADGLARALLTQSDQDANPVLLVTPDGEPVYRNPAADHLLAMGAGLRLEGCRLVATHQADQRVLRETIAQVARGDAARTDAPASVVTLACESQAPSMVVVLRAAGQVFMRKSGVRCGLVTVSVRGGPIGHDPASCVFAHRYGLTAAQAKVGALVMTGQSLSKIADALNVSANTVRSHLRQIFQKTETHSQVELVHLHARICTTLS